MDPRTEVVDVHEAADAFADMFDDNLEIPEVAEVDDSTKEVADAIEEELEEEEGEEDESEVEGEEESEEDSEEGEEESEEAHEGVSDDTLVDIEIDGEAYEVNFHELKAGYLRNEEYVKRSTELEEEHTQRMAELSQKEAELIREIEATAVIAQADLSRYQNVDWAKLKAEDPAKYAQEFSEFMEKRQAIQNQLTRRNQVQALTQKAEQIKHEAHLKGQLGLVKKLIPEFEDDGFRSRLFKFTDSVGLSKDEVSAIADARHLLIISQAMKFQESQLKRKEVAAKKKPQATEELPPVVKPKAKGTPVSTATKRQKALEAQALKTGSVRDAASAFEAYL